ncbi:MAG: formate--tetrahydrofolate ligase [Bacteroidota bacterium]
MTKTTPPDLAIAQSATLKPIWEIAEDLQVPRDELEPFGRYKAKLPLSLIDAEKVEKGNLILVTAITPTPAGEGKTTTSIGLTDGLNRIGKKAVVVLREPSLGPVFGMKGGAAGGGHAQVLPMEDINLHFTGDFSAIEKANNLLSALIDNNLQSRKHSLGLDPRRILWRRVMDMNDRALRHITIGMGGTGNGMPRQETFNITPASEVMAILCMAKDFVDLKRRLGNILVGFTYDRAPVYARDLKAADPMAILLKDAIKPNLVQTLEGNPALLHGGPFANIAQGTNSILATKMGLSLGEYVVTEAGFGADLGAEKFLDIKCQEAGLTPKAVVIVATVRALRHHGGAPADALSTPHPERVAAGLPNLEKHLENIHKFNLKPIVAINAFPEDSEEEIRLIQERCTALGVEAILAQGWAQGGAGMTDLAEAVVAATEAEKEPFKPLYEWKEPMLSKIERIAKEVYGADGVDYTKEAERGLKNIEKLGLGGLPVCMAKTQKSFSDNDRQRGRPSGFRVTVREFEFAVGAGFVIPILGEIMRMPGLPAEPSANHMHIDAEGRISGLF